MAGISQEQVLGAVRWAVTAGGAYAVGKGWIDSEQVTLLLGAAVALVPLAWSFYAHSAKSQVANVAAMPNVDKVVMTTPEAANAQPSPKVVSK